MKKFCGKCGAKLKRGASFCSKCGIPMENSSRIQMRNNYVPKKSKSGKVIAWIAALIILVGISGTAYYFVSQDGKPQQTLSAKKSTSAKKTHKKQRSTLAANDTPDSHPVRKIKRKIVLTHLNLKELSAVVTIYEAKNHGGRWAKLLSNGRKNGFVIEDAHPQVVVNASGNEDGKTTYTAHKDGRINVYSFKSEIDEINWSTIADYSNGHHYVDLVNNIAKKSTVKNGNDATEDDVTDKSDDTEDNFSKEEQKGTTIVKRGVLGKRSLVQPFLEMREYLQFQTK